MTLTSSSGRQSEEQDTNLMFEVEALVNSDGEREISRVECDPTNDEAADDLEAEDLGGGSWEFVFTVPASFDGSEPVFRKFRRYRLDPEMVVDACTKAAGAIRQA
jgi:hypothetical protein